MYNLDSLTVFSSKSFKTKSFSYFAKTINAVVIARCFEQKFSLRFGYVPTTAVLLLFYINSNILTIEIVLHFTKMKNNVAQQDLELDTVYQHYLP